LSSNYTEAIAKAGGIPVIFPTVADSALAAALIKRVDGVVFSGGPDLDPSWYGETIWNETVQVDTLRDFSDMTLMKAAITYANGIVISSPTVNPELVQFAKENKRFVLDYNPDATEFYTKINKLYETLCGSALNN
jgi:hypothetical protein